MRKFAFGCMGVLLSLFIIIAAGVGLFWFNVTRPQEFPYRINVPLPASIGGTLPLEVVSDTTVNLSNLSATATLDLRLTPAHINASLPTKDFSILVSETDYSNITSMLGRLNFVPNSATIAVAGREVTLGAQLAGEFYVRESRQYQKDEEQPGSGEVLAMRAAVAVQAMELGLTPQWGMGKVALTARVQLDEATRTAWHGKFGAGAGFADLVERILNERAAYYVGRLDVTNADMRTPLHELIERINKEMQEAGPYFSLKPIKISRVEADSCPIQDSTGAIVLGIVLEAEFDAASTTLPTLPDLSVRPGPC